jgi:hypothetical protein
MAGEQICGAGKKTLGQGHTSKLVVDVEVFTRIGPRGEMVGVRRHD